MKSPGENANPGVYVLGHSDRELDRLGAQANLIDPITRRFFIEAGILPGMRVLDVGTGAGDVAFLVTEIVGDSGEVVGVDRSPGAIQAAKARAADRSLPNVTFREGDPSEMTFDRPFDAVTGRYVLQFQKDPGAMLRKVAAHVQPGGVIVFHELDWDGVESFPASPTHDRCCGWIRDTLRAHGTETRMGIKLHSAFLAAGLPEPLMRIEAVVGGGKNSSARLHLVADLAGTLFPEMERFGIASAAEVGLETLVERMTAETAANGSVIVGHTQFGAWSRV